MIVGSELVVIDGCIVGPPRLGMSDGISLGISLGTSLAACKTRLSIALSTLASMPKALASIAAKTAMETTLMFVLALREKVVSKFFMIVRDEWLAVPVNSHGWACLFLRSSTYLGSIHFVE
jgi:hypothetical protein